MPADLSKVLFKAYSDLGYASSPQDKADKTILSYCDGNDRFITVLEDGPVAEFGELAVKLSKRLSTVVIVSSVVDSDSFSFLVFSGGKQIDAVLSEPPAPGSSVKVLKGTKRLDTWLKAFVWSDLLQSGPFGLSPETLAAMDERQRLFAERMEIAGQIDSPFADDAVARWCEVVGLEPRQALTPFQAIDRAAGPGMQRLHFARAVQSVSQSGPRPALAALQADEECPYHRFYPAPWPIEVDAEQRVRWFVTSGSGAVSGFDLDLGIEPSAGAQIDLVGAAAFSFHNGQVMSGTPLAQFERRGPLPGGRVEVAPFTLPALDAQARKQNLIELRVRVRAKGDDPIRFAPVLSASGTIVSLSPLILQPVVPSWQPTIMNGTQPRQIEARLRLNAPSVVSGVAMIDDDGAPVRQRLRRFSQAWFAGLSLPPGAEIEVSTETHLSPSSFRVSKTAKRHPGETLHDDKLWGRLFEGKSEYQTISVSIYLPDWPNPVAGLTVQSALHGMNGRLLGSLVTVSIWLIHEAGILARLATTSDEAFERFEAWLSGEAPAQAWVTSAAWIPEFDTYDMFRQTLYEEAADFDWFRSGMNGKLALRDWADRHLRFVAARMWLGAPLAGRLDREALQKVADVRSSPTTLRLTLKPGQSLASLEQVLSPILPPLA